MTHSGDIQAAQRPPVSPIGASSPHPSQAIRNQREMARLTSLLKAARAEVSAHLSAIQSTAAAFAGDASSLAHTLSGIQEQAAQAQAALDALDNLLLLQTEALRLDTIEVSDVLMAALSRWKTRAPRHIFELALPGYEPSLVGDTARITQALDALIAWTVTHSDDDVVRVSLRYGHPAPHESHNRLGSADIKEVAIIAVRAAIREDALAPQSSQFDLATISASAEPPNGHTLGLFLVGAVAEYHGGSVWTDASPTDQTVTLNLALPVTPPPAAYHISTLDTSAADDDEASDPAPPAGEIAVTRARAVVLVAHPDPRMARYLRANLDMAGFKAVVAGELDVALRHIDAEEPDIILLDLALPDGQHRDPLKRALARVNIPVIALSADTNPATFAAALDAGAADVIALPLSIEETLARVRRSLRLVPAPARHTTRQRVFTAGDLVVDDTEHRVTVAGAPVTLSKTEYRLLRALAQNAGKTLSHELLLQQVWGPGYTQEVEFIWVYIRRLRRKIEPDPASPRYILTIPGVGYRLDGQATIPGA